MDENELIINQRLNFEEMSFDEDEEDVSEAGSGGTTSTTNSGLLRKRLNFDFVDHCDLDYHVDNEDEGEDEEEEEEEEDEEMPSSKKPKYRQLPHDISEASGDQSSSLQLTPNSGIFSPCRTRSGRIYIAGSSSTEKPPPPASSSKKSPELFHPPRPKLELNLLQKNLNSAPPPLNYVKRPVSRIQSRLSNPLPQKAPISDPLENPHSPPTNEVRAMRLFDDNLPLVTSPVSAPRLQLARSRFCFADDNNRRVSAPGAGSNILAHQDLAEKKRKRTANINPFTPTSIWASLRKKARMTSGESVADSNNGSFEAVPLWQPLQQTSKENTEYLRVEPDESMESEGPAKRLKVSDINITRYEEEFVEIKEIASGTFGTVKVARHRLDGMVYAIKVTRNQIHGNTHEERVAMNEVFAHSALIKHKHVVRYYNSWVEAGRVYIQNEYCEGGSLASKIEEFRSSGKRFTEAELKRILLHLSKGLQYIHSKLLVHLDIKPENIFISLDHPVPFNTSCAEASVASQGADSSMVVEAATAAAHEEETATKDMGAKEAVSTEEELFSGNESTDSGHHSGGGKTRKVGTGSNSSSPVDDRVAYKIGDLGHVAPIHGDAIPEEGDCRYMAPELLAMDINRETLTKADIFSLGLTLFEAASLRELPKNSIEDPIYEKLKAGELPFLDGYSKEFNSLLKAMVHPNPLSRPSAARLANLQTLRGTNSSNVKSRSQLYLELKETKNKLRLLEQQLILKTSTTTSSETQTGQGRSKLVGKGQARSKSSNNVVSDRKW